jgi:hypothetical protein
VVAAQAIGSAHVHSASSGGAVGSGLPNIRSMGQASARLTHRPSTPATAHRRDGDHGCRRALCGSM